jgi:hypothetical protein
MPLSRIDIEQTAPDRWIAEIEVGGLIAKRQFESAPYFDEIVIKVISAYAAMTGKPNEPRDAGSQSRVGDDHRLPREPREVGSQNIERDRADALRERRFARDTRA